VFVLLLLVGCGRFGFDHHGALDGGELGTIDAPDGPQALVDVAPLDAMLPSGLVVWFPLDENPPTFADVVSGFPGGCSGSTCSASIAGHRGNAALFDGNDDCIQVPNMGQFGQAKVTLSLWLRQDAVDTCSAIAKPADVVSNSADTWQIETTVNNNIQFTSSHGMMANTRVTSVANALVIGQWQHIAATFDGTTKQLYINGSAVMNGTVQNQLTYDIGPMWIGCDNNSGTLAQRFNGAIDEVQLYNRALSAAEIQTLAAM
jgi:hypothetical protein